MKDQELTKEELTALCKKQKEDIKEFEEKLRSPSNTKECCKLANPSYDELYRQFDDLNYNISVLMDENDALRWSLTAAHKEMNDWKNRTDVWQEKYYEEQKRAEKLFDELEKLKEELL